MDFSDLDRAALTAAIKRLEEPGFAGKMTTLAGRPAELVARALPRRAASSVAKAAEAALTRALDIALFSLRDQRFIAGRVVHSALASASGAVGGAFGLAALPVELPVSTAIMPRLVHKGAAHSSSALMHRALAPIVARFTAIVSQKLALQGVAIIGAVGGAAVNLAFIEQYHDLARGHFTVRRLERVYGAEAVRAEYDQLKAVAELRQPVQIADMSQRASSLIQSPSSGNSAL